MRFQESLLPARSVATLVQKNAIETPRKIRLDRLISASGLIRAAVHLACWVPFITSAADSWRGAWRVVGDGAQIASSSWATLSTRIPLLGQPNELPHGPHDLGPMEYWLLALPVHIDPVRGVLWGAVLLCMLAASLTIEAAQATLGETGGLLAGGIVITMVTWLPGLAIRPYWNPYFGVMFFIAALSSCLAVLSGRRKWWPVLVLSASIAAQAHLMFAPAAVGLVLMGLAAGLTDEFRARTSYSWLFTGLVAGLVCWMGPLDQQFTNPKGNMSVLLSAENAGGHEGLAFAMRAMASLAVPSPLWWQQNVNSRPDLYRLLDAVPEFFGLLILAITAVSLVIAVRWLRSRELAGLAVISLLISATASSTFALIPAQARDLSRLSYLVIIMFIAVLLAGLTVTTVVVLAIIRPVAGRPGGASEANGAGARASGRHQRGGREVIPLPVRTAAALLMGTIVVLGAATQATGYVSEQKNSLQVSAALAQIERSLPSRSALALSVATARTDDRYRVLGGLVWALTAAGYSPDIRPSGRNRPIPQVTIELHDRAVSVAISGTS